MKQKWIYSIKIMSITFGLASISSWSLAAIQGLHFLHKDWEISCDNTHLPRCRLSIGSRY